MLLKDQTLLNKLKNHSKKIGLRRNIRKDKPKFVVKKRQNLNIQVLNFHSSILDKYKMLGNFFMEQNFRFLEFIAPTPKRQVLFNKSPKIKYITKEKIKKVVETIYKDKEKLVEDFRLKELITQRAQLIYNEQKMNDTKEIKETLIKELNRFSKDITSSELDDRIVLYTKLNNYLNTININHKNAQFKIDKNLYLNYESKEIKNIIKEFENSEHIEYKNINEYISNMQNITKTLGITTKFEKKVLNQKTINNILNIKNNTSINEITPLFTKNFENKILKMSENIFSVLNTKEIVNNTNKVEETTININQNIEQQLKSVFKNIVINKEYKNIFVNELNTIFLNTEYTIETKLEEINNSINNYIDTIVVQNQNKQSFNIQNSKIIEENIYNEVIQKVSKAGINLHHTLKKELYKMVVKKLSKVKNINEIKLYNKTVDEIVSEFVILQDKSIDNTSIVKSYNNINQLVEKYDLTQINKEYSNILNLTNSSIETISVNPMDILDLTKLGKNVSVNSTMEQRIEAVYENIIKNIKSNYSIKKVNEVQKEQIFKNIENLVKMENIEKFDHEYKNIMKQLIEESEYKEINSISNEFTINNIEKLLKIENLEEFNSEYKNIINQYKTINSELVQNNIYKTIFENINISNEYLNIENKKQLIKKIGDISKLKNIEEINKEYINLIEHYNQEVKNNIESKNINAVYENIINELQSKNFINKISSTQKTQILKRIESFIQTNDIKEINKEYENIITDFSLSAIFENNSFDEKIDKKEFISKLTDISKYTNIIQVNNSLEEFVKDYKIDTLNISHIHSDILSLSKLGDNVTISNSFNERLENVYENIIKEIKSKGELKQISVKEKSQILQRIEKIVKSNDVKLQNKEYKNIISEFSLNINTLQSKVEFTYENILKEIKSNGILKQITQTQKNQIFQRIEKVLKTDNIEAQNKEYQNIMNEMISPSYEENIESTYTNILKEIKAQNITKQITPIQKSQILKRVEKLVKIDDIGVHNKEYHNIIKEFISNTNTIENMMNVNKDLNVDKLYKNILNEITKKSTNKHISIINKNEILKKITKQTKLSNISFSNKEYQNIINEHKIDTVDIRDIHNDIFSLTKLGDNINVVNSMEEKIELLYGNILKEIKTKEPSSKISAKQKEQIVSKLTNVIKFDSIEQINKEYKSILNQFTNNIEHKNLISKEDQIDIIYKSVINSIKNIDSIKEVSTTQKNEILQKVQKITNFDSIENINKQTKKIVNEFVNNIQVQNIKNELTVDNLYKNILNEITKNSSNKYINIINKKELLSKVNNISKLTNITTIDKEYKKLISEYKIDYTNKMSMTSLGDNISISNNYEQKIDSVYQNIIKEIKTKQPHKQINTKDKSLLLQKINKLVRLNNTEQMDREYKELVEQFVYQSKATKTTRESIIQKLIDSSPSSYVKNEPNIVIENTNNTLIHNHHKSKAHDSHIDEGFVYISANEIKKRKDQNKQNNFNEIDHKINEKEMQFNMNVQNIYEKFDENLDELALKIFKDIKDELSMGYKRI